MQVKLLEHFLTHSSHILLLLLLLLCLSFLSCKMWGNTYLIEYTRKINKILVGHSNNTFMEADYNNKIKTRCPNISNQIICLFQNILYCCIIFNFNFIIILLIFYYFSYTDFLSFFIKFIFNKLTITLQKIY